MKTWIRQPCQVCKEQIDEDHESRHRPEDIFEPPWTAYKIVVQAMTFGMDAQMMLVKNGRRILFEFTNHANYRNSVMYLNYYWDTEEEYKEIGRMLKEDRLDDLIYPGHFMFSIHEAQATIEDFEEAGYTFEPTED